MATKPSRNPDNSLKRNYRKILSDIEVVADTIIIIDITEEAFHNFVGVQFFADAEGETPATPGAGTLATTIETVNNAGVFEPLPGSDDGAIDCTAPEVVVWDANTKRVQLAPTGITTATHWRAIWTGNLL